ncbi:MAG: DUF1761 domain-containing protein, partial [Thiotrichales bacterium]|nr:DUF1761 domain-containing protein [Thiotrichales bacterium]
YADVSIFAIAVAALAGMIMGGLWYSPLLFGNAWLAAIGKSADELGPAAPAMVGSMLSCLVTAAVVELMVASLGAFSLTAGVGLGCMLGVGVVAMAMLSDSLFSGWGWKLYFIQSGYRVSYLVVMGAICGAWPR